MQLCFFLPDAETSRVQMQRWGLSLERRDLFVTVAVFDVSVVACFSLKTTRGPRVCCG